MGAAVTVGASAAHFIISGPNCSKKKLLNDPVVIAGRLECGVDVKLGGDDSNREQMRST